MVFVKRFGQGALHQLNEKSWSFEAVLIESEA